MAEEKTYVFKDDTSGSNLLASLIPMMQNKNIDPAFLLALQNNRDGFGAEGGMWFIWLLFMWMMWGGNGFGGFGRNGDKNTVSRYYRLRRDFDFC